MPSCDIIMYHVRLWSPLSYPRRAALLSPPTRGSSHCVTLRPIASRSPCPLSSAARSARSSQHSSSNRVARSAAAATITKLGLAAKACVCVCVCVGEDRVAGARKEDRHRIVIG